MSSYAITDVVQLHPQDNVCVSARNLQVGEVVSVDDHSFAVTEEVRLGHKIALTDIASGEPVRKYGQIIGFMTHEVNSGEHVHSHNLGLGEFETEYASATEIPPAPDPLTGRTFQGYRRSDGKAGTRNYLAVISTVNCSASVSKYVAERFDSAALEEFPNVDGVVAFKHNTGCGMQFGGLNHQYLNRVMGGIARHPNIGAYLLIGLGCEQGAMGYLMEDQRLIQIEGTGSLVERPPVFSMQDMGGTVRTAEAAIEKVAELLPQANDAQREPIPASEIILATECGGSDGNSGITANAALGCASDMIVASGGTTILAETS